MTTTLKKRNNKLKKEVYADVERIKENLIDTTVNLGQWLGGSYSDSLQNAKKNSVAMKDAVSDYIGTKPFKAIGIAMATGLMMGLLFKTRRK